MFKTQKSEIFQAPRKRALLHVLVCGVDDETAKVLVKLLCSEMNIPANFISTLPNIYDGLCTFRNIVFSRKRLDLIIIGDERGSSTSVDSPIRSKSSLNLSRHSTSSVAKFPVEYRISNFVNSAKVSRPLRNKARRKSKSNTLEDAPQPSWKRTLFRGLGRITDAKIAKKRQTYSASKCITKMRKFEASVTRRSAIPILAIIDSHKCGGATHCIQKPVSADTIQAAIQSLALTYRQNEHRSASQKEESKTSQVADTQRLGDSHGKMEAKELDFLHHLASGARTLEAFKRQLREDDVSMLSSITASVNAGKQQGQKHQPRGNQADSTPNTPSATLLPTSSPTQNSPSNRATETTTKTSATSTKALTPSLSCSIIATTTLSSTQQQDLSAGIGASLQQSLSSTGSGPEQQTLQASLLAVDDDPLTRFVTQRMLTGSKALQLQLHLSIAFTSSLGVSTSRRASPLESSGDLSLLQLLKQDARCYDLILLDVDFKGVRVDVAEALQHIRSCHCTCPIIVLSDKIDDLPQDVFLPETQVHAVKKPLVQRHILGLINQLLRRTVDCQPSLSSSRETSLYKSIPELLERQSELSVTAASHNSGAGQQLCNLTALLHTPEESRPPGSLSPRGSRSTSVQFPALNVIEFDGVLYDSGDMHGTPKTPLSV